MIIRGAPGHQVVDIDHVPLSHSVGAILRLNQNLHKMTKFTYIFPRQEGITYKMKKIKIMTYPRIPE